MAVKKGEEVWPRVVKVGFASVRVYRVKSATSASGFAYTVAYTEGGQRRLQKLADPDKAIAEARFRAEKLAAGFRSSSEMTAEDAEILATAKEICGKISVIEALREWQAARNRPQVEAVKLSVAVANFRAAKEAAGRKVRKTYKPLEHLAQSELGAIAVNEVSHEQLGLWMAGRYGHPVYWNTAHKRFRSLWRWARKQGMIDKGADLAPEMLEHRSVPTERIGIINSTQLAAILKATHEQTPQYLAAVVVAAFCGLRSDEVAKQLMSDVDLKRGLLTVTGAKMNTPAYRRVTICKAAVEWLKLCPPTEDGRLVLNVVAVEKTRDIARTLGIDIPDNAYRHSYISHAVELSGDVAAVAIEAGNSPKKIFSNYRELVDAAEAKRWFALGPGKVLKVQ